MRQALLLSFMSWTWQGSPMSEILRLYTCTSWNFFRRTGQNFPDLQPLQPTGWNYNSMTWFSISIRGLTCGVVLQHRVLAEGLVPPGDQNFQGVGRRWIVTAQDHRGKQHGAHLWVWNGHQDGQQLWQKQEGNKMGDYLQQRQQQQ